jgi:hypothetical protein
MPFERAVSSSDAQTPRIDLTTGGNLSEPMDELNPRKTPKLWAAGNKSMYESLTSNRLRVEDSSRLRTLSALEMSF